MPTELRTTDESTVYYQLEDKLGRELFSIRLLLELFIQ